ncbi:HAD domain-containing protein [Streptomyces fuscigenes]|uniref:HAD domain-containing protein n=1 Tax=Streptomyces fuscigenes TaxID=1528880 RepID=UPI001EEAE463|nr:HAD domain-containing protein [Streptomyces fuscigenes]MCF3960511.1 hypothetical protein [Streptomyces fuscigenes]
MASVERPFLFLDVDGPLIPFGSSTDHPQAAVTEVPAPVDRGNPLLTRLDPAMGPRLMALRCRLVWATTWMGAANDLVAPRVGLPSLPVLDGPDSDIDEGPRGLHWKTRRVVEWADGRPFIWVDDEITAIDRFWVDATRTGPSLLHRVDPAKGLTDADFSALADWISGTAAG